MLGPEELLIKVVRLLQGALLAALGISFVVSLFAIEARNWTPIIITLLLTGAWWFVSYIAAYLDPFD